jgi:membrane protein DedA with SNARE-associated domain
VHHVIQFVLRHGQLLIFATVLAEQMGLPIPAAPVLLAAGALIGMGALLPVHVILVGIVASLIADFIWFELGVRKGDAIVHLLCKIALEPDTCVRRTQDLYRKFGVKSLLFCKWIPGLSTVAPPLSGAFGVPRWKFLAFDGIGASLWVSSYVLLGWLFRAELEWLAGIGDRMGSGLGALLAAALGGYIAWKYYQRRKVYGELRVARIEPEEVKRRLDAGEQIVIVDYRHPAEWTTGIIPGALRMRPEDLDQEPHHLLGDREVILYCS